jgi:hypothetical protein
VRSFIKPGEHGFDPSIAEEGDDLLINLAAGSGTTRG